MNHRLQKPFVLSLWYTLNLIALFCISVYSFPKFDKKNVTYPSPIDVLEWFRHVLPVATPQNPITFLLTVLLLLTLIFWSASAILAKILKWLSLEDIYKLTHDAVSWGVRNYFVSGIVLLNVIPWSCIFIGGQLNDISFYLLTVYSLAVLISMPIVVLNKRVLEADYVQKWYRIDWSGWQPVLVFFVGFLVSKALDLTVDALLIVWSMTLVNAAFQVAWYVVGAWVFGVLLSVLVYKIRWHDLKKEIRVRANTRFCAVWLLLNVRFFVIMLWVVPPFIVGAIAYIYVIPQLWETLAATGTAAGTFLKVFVHLIDSFSRYWYFIVIPLNVVGLMIYGRCLLLYDNAIRCAT